MLQGGQQGLGEGPFQEQRRETEGRIDVMAFEGVPEARQEQGQIAGADDALFPILARADPDGAGRLEEGPCLPGREDLGRNWVSLQDR